MKQLTINWLAILASVVALFALGFLWYGPIFGEQWMHMVGLDLAKVEANPPSTGLWISNLISTVVPVYALAWLCKELKVETVLKGAAIGLLIAFAFNHLPNMTGNMFADRPYGLAWITGGFSMVGMAIAGAILGGWRKYTE